MFGGVLGAVAGDIIGSDYEFIDMKDYDFEMLPEGSRFTDDTVMTIAVAKWIMEGSVKGFNKKDLIGIMQQMGREYPYAGYGSSFNAWLWRDDPQPYNSWGNGAAMRVSPVGLYAETLDEALELAKMTAEVSHNHPEGIKGAQAVAAAVWMAKNGHDKDKIRNYISEKFNYDLNRTVDDIRPRYEWDVSCQRSVPESILCFLEGFDFEDVVRLAVSLGGDSDTMACIAGSIAACIYPIPEWIENKCIQLLPASIYESMRIFEQFLMKQQLNHLVNQELTTAPNTFVNNGDDNKISSLNKNSVNYIKSQDMASKFDEATEDNNHLESVASEGKWGFIDKTGKWVIEPKFDFAWNFKEGLACVKYEGMWGYIDKSGKLIIDIKYDEAWPFNEGIAKVESFHRNGYIDKHGEWVIKPKLDNILFFNDEWAASAYYDLFGYIDKSGKWMIKPKFDQAFPFNEGIGLVQIDGKYGYINKSGEVVIKPIFERAWPFNDGVARVQVNNKYGFINTKGTWIVEPKFKLAYSFKDGLGIAMINDKYGYIDNTGEWVITPMFDEAWPFNESLAAVKVNNQWGFVDKNGEWTIEPMFDDACHFNKGIAAVKIGHKWGFVDKTGKWIIDPKFDNVWPFNEAVLKIYFEEEYSYIDKTIELISKLRFKEPDDTIAQLEPTKVNGKWGYTYSTDLNSDLKKRNAVNNYGHFGKLQIRSELMYSPKDCNWVIEPLFDDADDFNEGLAPVKVNEKWGFINKTGEWAIEPIYDEVWPFLDGMAKASHGKWGYINKFGEWIIEPKFDEIGVFSENLLRTKVKGKWGYVDKTGEWVIKAIFDDTKYFNGGLAATMMAGKWGFINRTGEWVIEPQFDYVEEFVKKHLDKLHEEVAYIEINGKCGYIDKTGKIRKWINEPKSLKTKKINEQASSICFLNTNIEHDETVGKTEYPVIIQDKEEEIMVRKTENEFNPHIPEEPNDCQAATKKPFITWVKKLLRK